MEYGTSLWLRREEFALLGFLKGMKDERLLVLVPPPYVEERRENNLHPASTIKSNARRKKEREGPVHLIGGQI